MNTEFDLDNLKAVWQEESAEKSYSSNDIFEMLKRKSITSVKWVFIISLIEILIGVVIYIVTFSNIRINEFHNNLIQKIGNWAYVYEFLTFMVYAGTIYFIFLFFKKYKEIQVNSSIKELSVDIINFRKVVNYFIYFNLVMLLLIMIVSIIPIALHDPELQHIDFFSVTGLGLVVGLLLSIGLMVGVLWLYYYLVYGTFQRRLKRNLKELNTLE